MADFSLTLAKNENLIIMTPHGEVTIDVSACGTRVNGRSNDEERALREQNEFFVVGKERDDEC